MSTETIPGKVPAVGSVWVKKPNPVTVAASISTGVSYNFNGGSGEATLSRFLQEYEPADRATRPAEPAAPVAEAGEVVAWGVEMYGFWELCNDEETARYRHEPARKVEPLVRLSTLEAERARADAAEARIVELEAVEKTLRWSVSDSEASLAAAEQRAADALARAEKVERERDAYHDALTPDGDTKALMIGEFFEEIEVRNPDYDGESQDEDEDEDDEPEFITHRVPVSWTTTKAMMERLRSYAHRLAASREAQAATDGGDNG